MISADGWFDWAIQLPGPQDRKINTGVNPVKGIFFHSAEGYKTTLLDLAVNGPLSWHLSNMMNGTLYQHYPLTARCWHATAANNSYVGMEHEGKHDGGQPTISDAQVATDARVIEEIAAWKGWLPTRPSSPLDISHTLWEHGEVIRLGGSGSECPDGRIRWNDIFAAMAPPAPTRTFLWGDEEGGMERRGAQLFLWNQGVDVLAHGDFEGKFPGALYRRAGNDWIQAWL